MAERKVFELTEEERRAAEYEAVLLEIARRINGPNAPSVRELFPNAIPLGEMEAAAGSGQTWRVKVALNNGADVNEKGAFGSPLRAAVARGTLAIVRLLVEQGADYRALDPAGKTPAEVAAANGHAEVAEYLRSLG